MAQLIGDLRAFCRNGISVAINKKESQVPDERYLKQEVTFESYEHTKHKTLPIFHHRIAHGISGDVSD